MKKESNPNNYHLLIINIVQNDNSIKLKIKLKEETKISLL